MFLHPSLPPPPHAFQQEADIMFTVFTPPRHGTVDFTLDGVRFTPTLTFSMSDVYENRISYNHDGTNTLSDQFEFTVSDGTNPMYVVERGMEMLTTSAPQVSFYFLKISIYAVINCDNGGNF